MMEPVNRSSGRSGRQEGHTFGGAPDRSLRLSVEDDHPLVVWRYRKPSKTVRYCSRRDPSTKPYRWMIALGPEVEIDIRCEAVHHVLVLGPVRRRVCSFHVRPGRRAGHDAAAVAPDPLPVGASLARCSHRVGEPTAWAGQHCDQADGSSSPGTPSASEGARRAGGRRACGVPMLTSGGLAVTPPSSRKPRGDRGSSTGSRRRTSSTPDSQENRRPRPHVRAAAGPRRPGCVPGARPRRSREVETVPVRTGLAASVRCAASWTVGEGVPVRDVLVANGGRCRAV